MFAIDLLNGKAIPERNNLQGIMILAATFLVPIVLSMVVLGYYSHNKIQVSMDRTALQKWEQKVQDVTSSMDWKNEQDGEKEMCENAIEELGTAVSGYMQWTPILVKLVEEIPGSVILSGLQAERSNLKVKRPSKKNPDKLVNTKIDVQTLALTLRGRAGVDYQDDIAEYAKRLRNSELIGGRASDIRISTEIERIDERSVETYTIRCVFELG